MKTRTEEPGSGPRHVLVIGASTSIGVAITERFVAAGDRVLATTHGGSVAPTLTDRVLATRVDLANRASLDAMAVTVKDHGAPLDIVLFLTGILPGKALEAYDDSLVDDVMTINFSGQASLLRRLQPHLRDGARILFMSSVSGERGSFDPIYAASKAAQIAFVKSLATWLAPRVRVNAVAPALIEGSSMFNAMAPERREHHRQQTPTGQLTTRDELASIVFDLCGPAWANLNGQVIRINGGVHV